MIVYTAKFSDIPKLPNKINKIVVSYNLPAVVDTKKIMHTRMLAPTPDVGLFAYDPELFIDAYCRHLETLDVSYIRNQLDIMGYGGSLILIGPNGSKGQSFMPSLVKWLRNEVGVVVEEWTHDAID